MKPLPPRSPTCGARRPRRAWPLAGRGLLAGLLVASPVLAEPASLARPHTVVLSLDRLAGLSHTSASGAGLRGLSGSLADSTPGVALLSPNQNNPYATSTLGLHYVFSPPLTIGLNLGFSRESGESRFVDARERPPRTTLLLHARVGYLLGISSWLCFWARGGVTYFYVSAHRETSDHGILSVDEISLHNLALSLDPMLVVTPVDHLGLTLGGVGDLGILGSLTRQHHAEAQSGLGPAIPDTVTRDSIRVHNLGVQVGALGYF